MSRSTPNVFLPSAGRWYTAERMEGHNELVWVVTAGDLNWKWTVPCLCRIAPL
jgi:hypothetical protein